MDVRYSDHLEHAFVVSPDHLKKLVELLQKRIGKVNISADCADKIERKFNTVKDLIAYENSKSKRIRRIRLGARSDDYSKSATIVFRDSFYVGSGISIDVTGREDVVSRLKEEILDVVTGIRSWYNVMFYPKTRMTIPIVFGAIIGFWISLVSGDKIEDTSFITYLRDMAPTLLIVSIIIFSSVYISCKYLFPQVVFTIGQGKSHFQAVRKNSLECGNWFWCLVCCRPPTPNL